MDFVCFCWRFSEWTCVMDSNKHVHVSGGFSRTFNTAKTWKKISVMVTFVVMFDSISFTFPHVHIIMNACLMCVSSPEFTVIVPQSVTNIPAFFSCRLWIPNPLTLHHQQSPQVCQRSLEGTNNAWPLYSLASYKYMYMYSGSIINLQDPRINRVKSFIYDGERGGGGGGGGMKKVEGGGGGQQMAKIYIRFEGTNWPSKSKAWQIGMYVLGESLYH